MVDPQWINETCGSCEFCNDGDQQLCPNAKNSGYTVNGTFQQYCVCKATNAVRIPDEVSLDEAAPVSQNLLDMAQLTLMLLTTTAIAGAGGGLGTLACQYAKALGYRVLALSTGSSKQAMLVEEIGVDYFVDYIASQENLIPEIQELTGGGPHAAIVVASYVRPKGTVVVVGLPKNAVITADLFSTVLKQKIVKGSYVGSPAETEEALAIYAKKRFPIQYQTVSLEELPAVFEKMEQGKMQGRTVLKIPSPQTMVNDLIEKTPKFRPNEYNIGTLLASRLEEIGIKDYFVVPGDFNLTLIDQILKNPNLRMVGCCNELNAGYAADGYSRSSPARAAVVFVTFMVGGLSLLNAIAGAYSERLRVIVVSGAPPTDTFGQDCLIHHTTGLKERDQAIRMFEHVTTASVRLDLKANPASVLDQALLRCLENSLPVYIELPANLAEYSCDVPRPLILSRPRGSLPSLVQDALDLFTRYWREAQSPVILVGPLARHGLTRDTLLSFIEKLGCPVFCQPDAKSLVPEEHPQFQGTFWGSISDPACIDVVMNSDLWVGIGTRSSDYNLVKRPTPPMLDLSPDHLRAPKGNLISPATMADLSERIVLSNLTGYCMESHNSASHETIKCSCCMVLSDGVYQQQWVLNLPGQKGVQS
ncbi:Pyruvate decarboxylase 3 [Penicillium subrubescens]|uniref:pyruvate decarboxylase n=1 Tax=Penicillium subrubescens TaxID=1316194 RepID=A0A1Q5UCX0_9EURO|nr:Pyruvate decarboxylase 3 [Penicillium subrubescens]